jgi:hypothetical protein
MAYTVEDADVYFNEYVLHNDEWVNADYSLKQRAVNSAMKQLYRHYTSYNQETRPIPDEAVFEQALWVLRIDDSFRRAEMGVTAINVAGISINMANVNRSLSPQVIAILGRKVGRYQERVNWTVANDIRLRRDGERR